MPIHQQDHAVKQLAQQCRQRGLAVSDIRCWRLLERIDSGGPDPINHDRHGHDDVQALALTALTQAPRPDWVCQITGLTA